MWMKFDVDSGQWVMHSGVLYDPIQGQDQGHETWKVRNYYIFKLCLFAIYSGSWQFTADPKLQYSI